MAAASDYCLEDKVTQATLYCWLRRNSNNEVKIKIDFWDIPELI